MNTTFKGIVLNLGLRELLHAKTMNNHLKRIRRELKKRGYTEGAIVEVLKWYQPSKRNRAVNKKQDSLGILRWRDISGNAITINQPVRGHRPHARTDEIQSLREKVLKSGN